jgi:hypothetical protein
MRRQRPKRRRRPASKTSTSPHARNTIIGRFLEGHLRSKHWLKRRTILVLGHDKYDNSPLTKTAIARFAGGSSIAMIRPFAPRQPLGDFAVGSRSGQ